MSLNRLLGIFLVFLVFSATALGEGKGPPHTKPIEQLADEMFRRAESMVEHGREGHTDEIVKFGKKMLQDAEGLMKSLQKNGEKEDPVLPYLDKAIHAGQTAVQEGEGGNHRAALTAARTALRYARLTRERLNSP